MIKSITIVTSEFPPQPGGIGNHAYNLALHLVNLGYDVTVVSDYRDSSADEIFDKSLNFRVVRIQRNDKFILKTYISRILNTYHCSKKADVLLFSGKFSLWIGGILSVLSNTKRIAVVHGSEVLLSNTILRSFTNWCLNRMNKIIAVSNYTKSLLSLDRNVEVINNGFNASGYDFRREAWDSEILNFTTIGNVTERKGQINFIKSIPYLLKDFPELHYHMIGIPTDISKLQTLALRLGVSKNISFHGALNEEDKVKLLKSTDIFIMLSQKTHTGDVEGFGIAILEANAMGIPAIGSKNSGIEDAISNEYSGITVNYSDESDILRAIRVILKDYNSYSENALEWSKNFGWEKIIQKYNRVLCEL